MDYKLKKWHINHRKLFSLYSCSLCKYVLCAYLLISWISHTCLGWDNATICFRTHPKISSFFFPCPPSHSFTIFLCMSQHLAWVGSKACWVDYLPPSSSKLKQGAFSSRLISGELVVSVWASAWRHSEVAQKCWKEQDVCIRNADTKTIGKVESDMHQSKLAVFQTNCLLSLIKLCGINLTAFFYNATVQLTLNKAHTVRTCAIQHIIWNGLRLQSSCKAFLTIFIL